MKFWTKFFGLLLSILLLCNLCACKSDDGAETTVPTGPVVSTKPNDSSTVETTVPVPTEPDPFETYEAACQQILSQGNLVIRFDTTLDRSIGKQKYTTTSTGSASYANLGTKKMEALIREELDFSGYSTSYIHSYIEGKGYCRVDNYNFYAKMTADEFLAQQMPAALITSDLYAATEHIDNADGTCTLNFSEATALENWVENSNVAQLITAYGSVTLSDDGAILATSYHAEYTIGNVSFVMETSNTVEAPETADFSSQQPVYPKKCAELSDLRIPLRMLQVVGELYATESISASYTDTLYSAAFSVIRTQNGTFNLWGMDKDLLCSMDTKVMVTDYAGNVTSNSQEILFKNGKYSYSTNGGDKNVSEDVKPEDVRISCEDAILSSLFEFGHISSATLKDTGDFLQIRFEASDEFTNSLCSSIYALFSMDLDTYADSYTTESVGGYLYINKYTGLPTSLGIDLQRTHIIAGASYVLTYQLDQQMELPSLSAYTNITGEADPSDRTLTMAEPLFYKVTNKKGQVLWLLGTIHAGDYRTGNLPSHILSAFENADALAVEFNTNAFEASLANDSALIAALTEAYYYPDGGKYTDHLGKDPRSQLKQLIMASGNNNANTPYMKLAIWNSLVETFYLQQGTNLSTTMGMDARLLRWAETKNKPIYEIESGLAQIQLLSGFSDELQAMLLESTMDKGLLGYGQELTELYELWCAGDEDALTAYLDTDTSGMSKSEKALYKEYYQAMYKDRNKVMHKAAVKYLKSGKTVFYAVGLAHLLGDDGLVASLRDAGYTVELVTNK